GDFLRAHAACDPWESITLTVKAPTSAEVMEDLDGAIRWSERFHRDSCTGNGRPRFAVEYRTIKGHGLGSNEVPCRVRIDSFDVLCTLLGTGEDVRSLDAILETTRLTSPALVTWVTRHPLEAIAH